MGTIEKHFKIVPKPTADLDFMQFDKNLRKLLIKYNYKFNSL